MRLALFLLAAVLAFPAVAGAQVIAPGALAPCGPALATAGGTAWVCPFGGVRGIVDVEGGTHAYESDGQLDRGKLRLNLSGGEAVDRNTGQRVREAVALNPDVGGCTRVYDGRRFQIASFCPDSFQDGGIRFFRRPVVCTDRCREVATVDTAPPPTAVIPARLRRRVARLERLTKRLRVTVRRLARRVD
jgi:hypothetical protein